MALPLYALCSASFIALQPFLSFCYRPIKHPPSVFRSRSWDLPNNGWLCPRSDKKPQSKKPQSLFLSSVFSPLSLFPHSFQIISAAHNNNYWGRRRGDKGEAADEGEEGARGETEPERECEKYCCQWKRAREKEREVEELLLLVYWWWNWVGGGARREQQC